MKINIIAFTLMLIFLFICCENSSDSEHYYRYNGIITGYDLRECACCGGWFIRISDTTYRFYDLPKENNIDFEKDTLPLKVKLDWKKSSSPCLGDEIILIRIRKY
jgi:hypothetical protein